MAQKPAGQEPGSSDACLALGANVQIINLNTGAHYNVQLAKIVEPFNDETVRLAVTLNGGLKKLALKSCNAKLVVSTASLEVRSEPVAHRTPKAMQLPELFNSVVEHLDHANLLSLRAACKQIQLQANAARNWGPARMTLEMYLSQCNETQALWLKRVRSNSGAFKIAPLLVRKCRAVFRAAMQPDQDGRLFLYAADELRADKDFVLATIGQKWSVLRYVDKSLRDDSDVVLAAVRRDAGSFRDASTRLRSDRNFILAAVKQNGLVLQHLNKFNQDDTDVVRAAVLQNAASWFYASARLRSSKKLVKEMVQHSPFMFEHLPRRWQTQESIRRLVYKPFWLDVHPS